MIRAAAMLTLLLLWGSSNTGAQVSPPAAGCYHSAFTPDGQQAFEMLAGKDIAIKMDYRQWATFAHFPASAYTSTFQRGSIPHCTWEPWDANMNHPDFDNQSILAGAQDDYIRTWAVEIKSWGHPLMLRWGHEMNGNWYPWDGVHSGGSETRGFGDASKADGPERYIAAYRHIHHLFDSMGVHNVTWIWSPNAASVPNEAWNAAAQYYPGDDVVDWIGLDGYNFGTSQSWSQWITFFDIFKQPYNTFASYGKPMMIAECGSSEAGGNKAQWISDAFLYLRGYFHNVKAVTWFNINKETDWRIDSSPAALTAYQKAVRDSFIVGTVRTTGVTEGRGELHRFDLLPAYPNPFNGSTRMKYSVPSHGEYSIVIYNMLGQRVRELSKAIASPGTYTIEWDGNSSTGHPVSSGVYLVALISHAGQIVRRVVVTK